MILDGHIHIDRLGGDRERFMDAIRSAGVDGGIVISMRPASFNRGGDGEATAAERLDDLLERTSGNPLLYPFYWIDPLEKDALGQVDTACAGGVAGFKVICNRFYPYDEAPMEVFRHIAEQQKPILFHSGILWDGAFSSIYNRPAGFEALIAIKGLRFSLAHASWPWIDECIALYGKFQDAGRKGPTPEMFIDITPGTPAIYRKELIVKLYTVGYDIERNVAFGTDRRYGDYDALKVRKLVESDSRIYSEMGLDGRVVELIFSGNLKRFVSGV